ncbi:MAG: hypothetical protein LUO93_05965 [Methanomicrobiales archaeon]|nr:hypothetical protein [Methanomicrobiales archaeon]
MGRKDLPEIKNPTAFWTTAGKRAALHLVRARRRQLTLESIPDFYSGVEEEAINNIAISQIPPRIIDYADRLSMHSEWDSYQLKLTGAERVYLHRWRKANDRTLLS